MANKTKNCLDVVTKIINDRGFEILLKLVYGTFDDSRGNIASSIFFFARNKF